MEKSRKAPVLVQIRWIEKTETNFPGKICVNVLLHFAAIAGMMFVMMY
jgi:hypothetical protein